MYEKYILCLFKLSEFNARLLQFILKYRQIIFDVHQLFIIKLAKYEIQTCGWDDLTIDHRKHSKVRSLNNVLRDGNAC